MDAIAIVGMGCRLPGGVRSPDDLWELIMNREIANTPRVPSSRFNIDAYYHQNNDRPGSFFVPGGYFLDDDPADFDPNVFKINPIEAVWMDPQQRKLLEVVYETLENGGVTLEQVSKSVTGCFVASFTSDFQQMVLKEPDFRYSYAGIGIDPGVLGNRVSHAFNLTGPSVLVNTACSSSMYALDMACASIQRGECEGAIVGGSNLILTVDQHMNTSKLGVLSPTNQCHTFDAAADGYGRAEAVGALYVKRLSAAIRDGNPIRAVIRGVATNSNGKHAVNGITYPSVSGQRAVMNLAHEMARLNPIFTSYVECHGTGTPVGDPIEVRAVSETFRSSVRSNEQGPILVGSIKPNIGHSEAASSISTIIKAVLALERGVIPPTAGITNLNTQIDWEGLNAKVVTDPTPFPSHLPVRRIGINAFGYGGTNGHVVLEGVGSLLPDYRLHKRLRNKREVEQNGYHRDDESLRLLVFSSHSEGNLMQRIESFHEVCERANLSDVAYTLVEHRTALDHRAFAVCRESTFVNNLELAKDTISNAGNVPKVAFAFTGQGAQWAGMGIHLLKAYPCCVETIRDLDYYLRDTSPPPDWRIEDALFESEAKSRINDPLYAQPLCTALQIMIVDLLEQWNIRPLATVGHSSGEIAAAYASGRVSAKEAIVTAYYRGLSVSTPKVRGAMLAVGLGADEVTSHMKPYSDRLVIACHNSPSSVTVSGEAEAIDLLKSSLDAANIFARLVKTGGQAYHSHLMNSAGKTYRTYLKNHANSSIEKTRSSASVMMFSSVTTDTEDTGPTDKDYWCRNLTSPVLFNQAVQKMLRHDISIDVIVEIGPHASFSGTLRQIFAKLNRSDVAYLPSLRRKKNDQEQLLKLAGGLWTLGSPVDLATVVGGNNERHPGTGFRAEAKLLVDLPAYSWTYPRSLFSEFRNSSEHRFAAFPRHDILGRKVLGSSTLEPVWRNILRHQDLPWLKHHSLGGEAVFPAAGYLAMAIEAMAQVNSLLATPTLADGYTLRDVTISTPLVIPEDDSGVETLLTLRPCPTSKHRADGVTVQWYEFLVTSLAGKEWREHATGQISMNSGCKGRKPHELPGLHRKSTHEAWNERMKDFGFDYGPSFHNSTTIYTDGKTHAASADAIIRDECGLIEHESRYVIHPACLDSCLQLTIPAVYAGRMDDILCGNVLTHFDEVSVCVPAAQHMNGYNAQINCWLSERGNRNFKCNVQLIGHDNELIVDIEGVHCHKYEAAILDNSKDLTDDEYARLEWKPDVKYLERAAAIGALSESTLEDLIALFRHQNPALRVLGIGSAVLKSMLRTAIAPGITFSPSVYEDLETMKKEFEGQNQLEIADLETIAEKAKEDPTSIFDLVISTHASDFGIFFLDMPYVNQQTGRVVMLKDEQAIHSAATQNVPWVQSFYIKDHHVTVYSLPIMTHNDCGGKKNLVDMQVLNSVPKKILLVYRETEVVMLLRIAASFEGAGFIVRSLPLLQSDSGPDEVVILLTELEGSFFQTLEAAELTALQRLTAGQTKLVCLTQGGLIEGLWPLHGMTAGWARVLKTENQLLDITTIDLDDDASSIETLESILIDVVRSNTDSMDTEYCISHGIVYTSRVVSDKAVSQAFGSNQKLEKIQLQANTPLTAQAHAGKITYHHDFGTSTLLGDDEIEIEVRAIGLNTEDFEVTNGADLASSFSHEISGTVLRIGRSVPETLAAGDSVFGFALNTLGTHQRTRFELVRKIPEGKDWATMAALPMASATALYALEEMARVQEGEVVVVLDGCGIAGVVAVQLIAAIGAHPILMTNHESTLNLVRASNIQCTVFNGGKDDLAGQLYHATKRRDADVLFGSRFSNPRDLETCSRFLAPFGRVVLSGAHSNSLQPALSCLRSVSILQFDIRDLMRHKPKLLNRLLERITALLADGTVEPVWSTTLREPTALFEAFHSISSTIGDAKQVLQYCTTSEFEVVTKRPPLHFSENATYLLVGCLGGLGRSLTTWMIDRGAKRLAFLSRSGTKQPAAAELVQSIRDAGVSVDVLTADVTSRSQVESALKSVDTRFPIRGIVNAAVVYQDGLFQNMDINQWHAAVKPKVQGSQVLHDIFSQPGQLDFFVMTSSISAMIGNGGQSNYAAANAFLDALSRHRHSLSLPSNSIVLPAVTGVGHVAENPELEASIRRQGMSCINETAMLRAFEVAMMPGDQLPVATDHIIVGLQPSQLASSIKAAGVEVHWLSNPRFRALRSQIESHSSMGSVPKQDSILSRIASAKHIEDAIEMVTEHMAERLARLILIDVDHIQRDGKSLTNYGLDSMIGAEFRNQIFRDFRVDVPFQQLLSGSLSVSGLAEMLVRKVQC